MGESYRSINNLSSDGGNYKKGSFVDSVMSDLRIKENEKKLVGKLISCNRCVYPVEKKNRDTTTIPGLVIMGYDLKPCGRIDDDFFPSRLCGKGTLKSDDILNSVCRNCANVDMVETFDVSDENKTKILLMLYHCATGRKGDNVWCRANYHCSRFKPKGNT